MTQQLELLKWKEDWQCGSEISSPSSVTHKPKTGIAIAALCGALVSISLAAIFIKFCECEISPYATAFNRFWITTLVLLVWYPLKAKRSPVSLTLASPVSIFSWRILGRLVLVGLFLSADLILWAWSLTQTSIANATLLANLTPLFTSFGAWMIWRRKFDNRFLMGMMIAIGGSFALGLNDLNVDPDKLQGDIAALLAAFSFGAYLLVLEDLQNYLNTTTILLWSSAIACVITFPLILISDGRLLPQSWHGWLAVIALALICQIIGQGLLVYSLNHLSSEFVALFLMLDPVLAAVGAWVFFAEKLTISNGIMFVVILLGIYLALSSSSSMKEEMSILS